MIWIVIEDNPWPDKYVPVFVRSGADAAEQGWRMVNYEVFDNEYDAFTHANHIKRKYNVQYVRLFYSDGYSKKVVL
jgi:hypothetical protein